MSAWGGGPPIEGGSAMRSPTQSDIPLQAPHLQRKASLTFLKNSALVPSAHVGSEYTKRQSCSARVPQNGHVIGSTFGPGAMYLGTVAESAPSRRA